MEEEGVRRDGRHHNELRPITCTRGELLRADGSARWACGDDTCVLAGVFGPRQGGTGKRDDPQRATLDVWWQNKSGQSGPWEKHAEVVLKRTLDAIILSSLLPRTRIKIAIQVISNGGSLLSCAINAACAALMHAGIPMASMLAAVECCIDSTHVVLLDPTAKEAQDAESTMLAVFPSRILRTEMGKAIDGNGTGEEKEAQISTRSQSEGLLTCEMSGTMDVGTFTGCVAASRAACSRIDDIMRSSVEASLGLATQKHV